MDNKTKKSTKEYAYSLAKLAIVCAVIAVVTQVSIDIYRHYRPFKVESTMTVIHYAKDVDGEWIFLNKEVIDGDGNVTVVEE